MRVTDHADIRHALDLTSHDLRQFVGGTHDRLYEHFGAHMVRDSRQQACRFAVWAPNARAVSVIGHFNGWGASDYKLERGDDGVWGGMFPGIAAGALYKYRIVTSGGAVLDKADPFAFCTEPVPGTASAVWDLQHDWTDAAWMQRSDRIASDRPISIYEVHLGSWRRIVEEQNRFLSYREAAPLLAEYLTRMNFTHVEFLPLMEHPFYGSWGYQTTGYFAPTRRYGTPQDLMFLIDYLHRAGIGVILDWVPSHFANDEHGLGRFDGAAVYEHADPRRGSHPDWGSYIFDYGRGEVRSFLLSSARFWLDVYHADALRVDGVASMLYLDYSRRPGEWIPNVHGGRENLDAIDFLRQLNSTTYMNFPTVQTIAEESTAWPQVSRPVSSGGLGFGMKWDMGWMHDTLHYMSIDPLFRSGEHRRLTFRGMYAFNENFILPLSHDEVVHGQGSLVARMFGDRALKFANLRVLFGYMYSQPGKKLLFMGSEIGQAREWDHEASLDWHELASPANQGLQRYVEDLNRLYRSTPALYEQDFDPHGFAWIDADNSALSVLTYERRGRGANSVVVVACNFTPVLRTNVRIGVPVAGIWKEVMNSDAAIYGGSGNGNFGGVESAPVAANGRSNSLNVILPPLSAVFFSYAG